MFESDLDLRQECIKRTLSKLPLISPHRVCFDISKYMRRDMKRWLMLVWVDLIRGEWSWLSFQH